MATNNLRLISNLIELQYLLDQIPIRHNWVSHFMFLGVTQAYFITFVIFLRSNINSAIRIFGWSLLFQAVVCTDTYLCYTGLMKHTLHWNDSTEFIVLLIPPSIYFFTNSLLERKTFSWKKHWPHFLLPILYLLTQVGYFLNPVSVKLNAYLDAYHPDIPMASVPDSITYGYHGIKDKFRWLVLFSFGFYIIWSLRLVIRNWKNRKLPTQKIRLDKYVFTRNTLIALGLLLVLILTVFLNYDDDAGDHYIVLFMAFLTFFSSFFILSESRFFENSWIADRYDTSTSGNVDLEQIEAVLRKDNYFLSSEVSLSSLSEKLGVGSNTLSKVINSEFGMNFNDFINQKRIVVARERLLDEKYSHLTIEAIGNSVGFNSKSAFYGAFKKYTNTSPSAFIKANRL